RQVAGVGRLQGRVGETLARAVRRDEVLENGQSFLEVVDDRRLDDLAHAAGDLLLRLGHQPAHTGELADLLAVTARARVGHHEDGVEAVTIARQTVERDLLHTRRGVRPGVDDLVIALTFGDRTAAIRSVDAVHVRARTGDDAVLLGRNTHVVDAHGERALRGVLEAEILERIQ